MLDVATTVLHHLSVPQYDNYLDIRYLAVSQETQYRHQNILIPLIFWDPPFPKSIPNLWSPPLRVIVIRSSGRSPKVLHPKP